METSGQESVILYTGVFRTQSNINNADFLGKYVTTKTC